jgi:hypothetical protein
VVVFVRFVQRTRALEIRAVFKNKTLEPVRCLCLSLGAHCKSPSASTDSCISSNEDDDARLFDIQMHLKSIFIWKERSGACAESSVFKRK